MTAIQRDITIELAEEYNNTDREIIKENIKMQLKQYRGDRDLLGEQIGISRHTLNSYTNIKGNVPDFVTALKLAKVLGITINDLIG